MTVPNQYQQKHLKYKPKYRLRAWIYVAELNFITSENGSKIFLPEILAPTMFPTDVWEFQIPIIKPFFACPNQFPTTATTPGQPVASNIPHKNCKDLHWKI